jgi:hypothetical protein
LEATGAAVTACQEALSHITRIMLANAEPNRETLTGEAVFKRGLILAAVGLIGDP